MIAFIDDTTVPSKICRLLSIKENSYGGDKAVFHKPLFIGYSSFIGMIIILMTANIKHSLTFLQSSVINIPILSCY